MLSIFLTAALMSQTPDASTPPTAYFPKGMVSDFEAEWYGRVLERLGEPALTTVPAGKRTLRFLLLPTWGNAVSVRVEFDGDTATLEAKRLDRHAGYDPGKLVEQGKLELDEAQTKELRALFDALSFTSQKTQDEVNGKDGSRWILEGNDGGAKHHVVVRWSPNSYDPAKRGTVAFVRLCEWLYRQSPLKEDARNKGFLLIEKVPKKP